MEKTTQLKRLMGTLDVQPMTLTAARSQNLSRRDPATPSGTERGTEIRDCEKMKKSSESSRWRHRRKEKEDPESKTSMGTVLSIERVKGKSPALGR
jgi:hypothetical protein